MLFGCIFCIECETMSSWPLLSDGCGGNIQCEKSSEQNLLSSIFFLILQEAEMKSFWTFLSGFFIRWKLLTFNARRDPLIDWPANLEIFGIMSEISAREIKTFEQLFSPIFNAAFFLLICEEFASARAECRVLWNWDFVGCLYLTFS